MRHRYTINLFFLIFFLGSGFSVFAQTLWQDEPAEATRRAMQADRGTLPAEFRASRLNSNALRTWLQQAEAARLSTGAPGPVLPFPLPDGTELQAEVRESSILSPELQTLIPGVKTYQLIDPSTGSSLGRITVAQDGVSGILFDGNNTIYITPVDASSNRLHASYFIRDLHIPEMPLCGVKDEEGHAGHDQHEAGRVNAGDCQLRTYRLAVAATAEYTAWAGSQADALTYITITVNTVNAIYERDATIRFTLVSNFNVIYTDPGTDPFDGTGALNSTTLNSNHSALTFDLGAPFDVGIVFNDGWSGGLAQLSSACQAASKGRAGAGLTFGFGANPSAGPQGPIFDNTVAHEIAHQFSATHSFSASNGQCGANASVGTAYEPGGGSTIMAYAGTCTGNAYQVSADLYFHAGSVAQIASYATTGGGNSCPVTTALTNVAPVVTVAAPAYTIPASTPFFLTCAASDANANTLTYTWEQMDAGVLSSNPPQSTSTTGPNFRSFPPSLNATRYLPDLVTVINGLTTPYEVLPSVDRTMGFRVNVRDNAAGGGCNAQENIAVTTSTASVPFTVTSQNSPVTLTADGSTTFTITWTPGTTTAAPFNSPNVSILFSADGGYNFGYTLAATTPNDGTETFVIPNIPTSKGRIMVRSAENIFYNVNLANITILSACPANGASLTPATTVGAGPGNAALNLSIGPDYGTSRFPVSGTLETTDGNSTLATYYGFVSSLCQNFNNLQMRYDTYPFQVTAAGSYTFTRSAGNYVASIYSSPFNPTASCYGLVASTHSYNGSSITVSTNVSAFLYPGITYTLMVGTRSETTPVLPYAYTITNTSTPPGASVLTGSADPGASFSYQYVVVNNATGNIVAILSSPNLSNASAFPMGTYTVYGFSFLTSSFPPATLNAYVGGPFTALTADLQSNPTTHCGNLSKNAVTVNVFVPLPVQLLPLTAAWESASTVKLYWATAAESNSSHFEIERSADGINFTTLHSVPAAFVSNSRLNYTTTDANPLSVRAYYRVKAVDIDGKFSYTNIASVTPEQSGKLRWSVYPNPTKDQGTLEILADKNGQGDLILINGAGAVVLRSQLRWQKGMNVETINLKGFAPGIYYVQLRDGNEVLTLKITKL